MELLRESMFIGIPIAEIKKLFSDKPTDSQIKEFLIPKISLLKGETLEDFDWPETIKKFRDEVKRVTR